MRAKTAITANTARKKEGCVAFANDDFENARRLKCYWEIIADNLSKAGSSWGCVSAIDSHGRTIWIAVPPLAMHPLFDLPRQRHAESR
jgi:hypothetical protein